MSMEEIRKHFLKGEYAWWFNMESDTIPKIPDVIEQMFMLGKGSAWISHSYPSRTGNADEDVQQGIGCSLLNRRLIERFNFEGAGGNYTPDAWLWNQVRPLVRSFPTTELWGHLIISHLSHVNEN